ncbi:unnamed protein product [Spirodela intermedia]|uniref:Uncharacterized protein n=1 Tax=Spirodela intermedia TaxID=51605 RepID=A0A7I8JPN8_SPIIN|nr:unnamed protein product [Spirodela intermedia]CAA6672148.1 unnamed protein product [Spirodela intermedia]
MNNKGPEPPKPVVRYTKGEDKYSFLFIFPRSCYLFVFFLLPLEPLRAYEANKWYQSHSNLEILWSRNLGVDRHEYEILTMHREGVVDFVIKFTCIILDLQNLGETMEEREVVQRFLWATPSKFDALTLSIEQYADLDKINLDEVIGSLTVHELWLKERESQEEEQALLARTLSKGKIIMSKKSLELVYVDICGPISPPTLGEVSISSSSWMIA